jgi:hypothetical protein
MPFRANAPHFPDLSRGFEKPYNSFTPAVAFRKEGGVASGGDRIRPSTPFPDAVPCTVP